MHFVTAWNIRATGDEYTKINNELLAVLKPYSWVRPLDSFFVIQVQNQDTWNKILSELQTVGQKHGKVNVILSPLMQGGRYNGLLNESTWKDLNERSK